MPVWWSIFAYMIVVSAFGMLIYRNKEETTVLVEGEISKESKYEKSIGAVFAFLSFALLVFFVGQRSQLSDTTIYQAMYDELNPDLGQIPEILFNTDLKGRLFNVLMVVFKHFTHGTYNDWFTFLAILQSIPIILLFYKYSINYVFTIFLFITGSSFIWYINGIRQFLAASLIILFVDDLINRKTLRFFIVVGIAFFIHSSAIFWIPVYLIVNYKPWSKKFVLLSVLLAFALFLYSTSSLIDDSEYSYLSKSEFHVGVNPLRVIVMSIPAIIAFIKRDVIKEKTNAFLDICINLSLITSECYIVGMFTSGIIGRMPLYFQFYNFLLLPWLLKNTLKEDISKIITLISIAAYFVYFCYEMIINGSGIYVSDTLNIEYWTTV